MRHLFCALAHGSIRKVDDLADIRTVNCPKCGPSFRRHRAQPWLYAFQRVCAAVDVVIKPFNLILWISYDQDEATGRLSIVGFQVGRRPPFSF